MQRASERQEDKSAGKANAAAKCTGAGGGRRRVRDRQIRASERQEAGRTRGPLDK
jgi:hypothetical protein